MMPASAFASTSVDYGISFDKSIDQLEQKYNIEVTYEPLFSTNSATTEEDLEKELEILENYLIQTQSLLKENNHEAEENWNKIKNSDRYTGDVLTEEKAREISISSAHTVYYYQSIGSVYPNGTTIQCSLTANRVFNSFQDRYLWGSIINTNSKIAYGKADNWEETETQTSILDGGRTYYVQVWGDLEESYYSGLNKYTITSEGWRIWYEAYCPA